MNTTFDMVAKTFSGLEGILASELAALGATDIARGVRMVSFRGDLAMLYRANMCCRTALRILKPFYSFEATDPDALYSRAKEYDWSQLLSIDKTFSIDSVINSEEFRNSQYVTYRIKDAIVDWFRDHDAEERRPSVRLDGADIMVNVHISGCRVTLSLDSSGESLHRRGWRVASTEAPISEVLAAGIILLSGWKGDTPFVDPMCGSGTFAIEAAMIAAGINPGVYRSHFAFENWPDFDAELLEEIYNDDSNEREVTVPIIAADLSRPALEIARQNARSAGVERYISFENRSVAKWTADDVPQPAGVLVTNPPYGKRIGSDDMNALYDSIGQTLKHAFVGYHAWIIGYDDVYFHEIGLAPSQKISVNNGGLDCELREYVIFAGTKSEFRRSGGRIKEERDDNDDVRVRHDERPRRFRDRDERRDAFKAKRDRRDNGPRRFRDNDDNEDRGFKGKRDGFKGKRDREDFKGKRDRDGFKGRKDDFKKRRDERYEHDDETTERPERRERRPIVTGRQPSIPADKEIVLNRPSWRVRKNKNNNEQ